MPSAYRNGKHSYASIAYEMTVTHSKKFQSTTTGHHGTTSDKTIVKFDGFVQQIILDKMHTNAEFELQVGLIHDLQKLKLAALVMNKNQLDLSTWYYE